MQADVTQVVGEITPYITAAVGAYGLGVLTRTQDEAADATVALGRRLAQRIFGVRTEDGRLPEALADIAAEPEDPDTEAALRRAVRRALLADERLAAEARVLLREAPAAHTGDGSQVVTGSVIGGDSIQIGSIGGDARIGTAARG